MIQSVATRCTKFHFATFSSYTNRNRPDSLRQDKIVFEEIFSAPAIENSEKTP